MNNDIILTGPPRSGTTLACYLLNKVDDTIALHEPMSLNMFPDPEAGIHSIQRFFPEMRASLLKDHTAISKINKGLIPSNPFGDSGETGRDSIVKKGRVHFDKTLSENFNLIIKHNAHFTFLLPQLQEYYPVFILLRHPVATIASWNSVHAPVSHGNLKVLKTLNPDLYNSLESISDITERQVILLDKMYIMYQRCIQPTYIHYEEMIESGGKDLKCISESAIDLSEKLENKNANPLYDQKIIEKIKNKLISFSGAYLESYSREAIENY